MMSLRASRKTQLSKPDENLEIGSPVPKSIGWLLCMNDYIKMLANSKWVSIGKIVKSNPLSLFVDTLHAIVISNILGGSIKE